VGRVITAGRLLERERELAALQAAIDDVVTGQARVLLVEGAAGIGKTRLLAEARTIADSAGLQVLFARGGELEREFPFGVVRQLFEPGLRAGDARLFGGAAATASGVFEPVEDDDLADPSFASLHGLYWLTVNLTRGGPVALVVDDLHWCDGPSLRFLSYLVRRLEDLPVIVVCSVRPTEQRGGPPLVSQIAADPLATVLRPGPLSGDAATQLVRERLGDDADESFASTCHAATGGNPLLLRELLKTLEIEGVRPRADNREVVASLGPRAASRAVLVRLARVSDAAVRLARAVAVLGDGAALPLASALAELPEDGAAKAAEELLRAEVLGPDAPLTFVHPLVEAAVLHELPQVDRQLHHERAARLLADAGAPAEQVAAQLLQAPSRGADWAVDALLAAGRSAIRRGAAESARVQRLARAHGGDRGPRARWRLLGRRPGGGAVR
jgi:predicted ATPase